MVDMVEPASIYRLLEAFTQWDNRSKTGPWQSSYIASDGSDPSQYPDVLTFSAGKVEADGGRFTPELSKLAPFLYCVGPVYGIKALGELDVAGFFSSGIPPKGAVDTADVPALIERYKTPSVWLPFYEHARVACAASGKALRFSSPSGCALSLDTEALDCSFQFGGYTELVFSRGKSDNSDTLRMIDLLVGCPGVPESKYQVVKDMLSKELSYLSLDETFMTRIAPAVVSVLGSEEYSGFLDALSERKLGLLDDLVDASQQPAYKDRLVRYLSAILLPVTGCDLENVFVSKRGVRAPDCDPSVFDPRALVLVPDKTERVTPYLQAMRSVLSAVYPERTFPIVSRMLENEQVKYQEAYPLVLTLSQEELIAELRRKEVGFVKIDITQTLSSMGKTDSVFTGLMNAQDEERRILMNIIGEQAPGLLKEFGKEKLAFKAYVGRNDDNRLFLTLKKTRYLN